mmetsp:Transcript_5701/g.16731  ORF Transcript_5701/g.16731 Transcript_5701/m.16731 type:complete len:221 (-) Transcript_5701:371-1033(-)
MCSCWWLGIAGSSDSRTRSTSRICCSAAGVCPVAESGCSVESNMWSARHSHPSTSLGRSRRKVSRPVTDSWGPPSPPPSSMSLPSVPSRSADTRQLCFSTTSIDAVKYLAVPWNELETCTSARGGGIWNARNSSLSEHNLDTEGVNAGTGHFLFFPAMGGASGPCPTLVSAPPVGALAVGPCCPPREAWSDSRPSRAKSKRRAGNRLSTTVFSMGTKSAL